MSPRRAGSRWRFPGGSAALPPALVGEIQRARIFEAVCLVIAEEGFGPMTVAAITARAELSTKTFYDYFDDKEDCVQAALDAYRAELATALASAWSGADRWAERVGAALAALLDFGVRAPTQLRSPVLDAQTAGPALRAEQRRGVERLAEALAQGRAEHGQAADLPGRAEETIVAGIAWRIGCALLDGEPLAELEPELLECALAPYLGAAEARRFARSQTPP